MEKDSIKEAFQKVKNDMTYLENELRSLHEGVTNISSNYSNVDSNIDILSASFSSLASEVLELKEMIKKIHEELNNQRLYDLAKTPIYIVEQGNQTYRQTDQQINKTDISIPTHNPTVPQEIEGLKEPKIILSTGNEGVPTDQQTVQQTSKQTNISTINDKYNEKTSPQEHNIETNIKEAKIMLDSLDRLKKEIRQKFKRLTFQEMTVFSTIYQLEESDPENNTYREIARKLKLSESSIRDYTLRIIAKGIPLKKRKIDNKKVILYISQDLKNIATLSTIIQLRDL